MGQIEISVKNNEAQVASTGIVTAGTVGMKVAFRFAPEWESLKKTAVFRVNGKIMDSLYLQSEAVVPWELLKKPGCRLWAGVYGTNEDGSLQIPTVWADLGIIQPGVDPSGDESASPSAPVWQQLTEKLENVLQQIIHYQESVIQNNHTEQTVEAGEEYETV